MLAQYRWNKQLKKHITMLNLSALGVFYFWKNFPYNLYFGLLSGFLGFVFCSLIFALIFFSSQTLTARQIVKRFYWAVVAKWIFFITLSTVLFFYTCINPIGFLTMFLFLPWWICFLRRKV